MTFHDETPTSELPVVTDDPTRPLDAQPAPPRRPWYRVGRRAGVLALAGVLSLGVAGVALATGDTSQETTPAASSAYPGLPFQLGPSRAAAPRANRAARPTPTATATSKAKAKATSKARPKPVKSWVAPMRNFRINSCYGMRWGRLHQGIDFAEFPGAKILAASSGTVVAAGWNSGGYGNMVIIKHSAHLFTLYGHASRVLVHVGQNVKVGRPIALEGATGHVTGPHLHFEVWTAMWQRISPGPFLAKHGIHLGRCQ